MDAIVALATPPGNSGVAIIRLSGEGCKQILKKITKSKENFIPRYMYLKNVYAGNVVDNCLVVYFQAPNSFTGEDVVEIQLHGGYHLAQLIIEECVKFGARPALPGEYSKRAFLNGKMSLDQAEGIMELINAETDYQAVAGSKLLNGELIKIVNLNMDKLTSVLAEIEAKLDYPEYDFSKQETSNIKQELEKIKAELTQFVSSSVQGQIIKNGIKVAITGAPNVGKSSLLNALTKTDKAIVSSIPGTTRDVVEGEYVFGGIVFRLFDTAGIRTSTDEVENIGITRALNAVEDADIVLKVFDEKSNYEVKTSKPTITVQNKSDVKQVVGKDILVSAKTNKNINELKQLIFNKTVNSQIDANNFYITNARHKECLTRAIELLNMAIDMFETTSLDVLSSQIKGAWLALGEITGNTSNEQIIDRIFSKFCLGK